MPRKQGYRHIGLQLTPTEYEAVKKAAGKQELTAYLRSLLVEHTQDFPNDMPKRGKYQRLNITS